MERIRIKKHFSEKEISCGLDLGTSNTVISITDVHTQNELFSYADKSILYYPEMGDDDIVYVGKEAQEQYLKNEMRGRLLKSIKTLLNQDDFLFTWICGKKVTPEQMVTHIIRHFKKKAEDFVGININNVVLGRPAIFSKDPQKENLAVKRLLIAAQKAGFKEIQLQLEPIAAAFSYERLLKKAESVLVADFGGGTSDFTVARLAPNKMKSSNREKDILANGGLYIGGDLYDSEIMWYKITPLLGRGVLYQSYNKQLEVPNTLYRELCRWEKSFLLKGSKARRSLDKYYVFSGNDSRIDMARSLIDNNSVYMLFKEIEQAKIDLSISPTTRVIFSKDNININEKFSYIEFENIIDRYVKEIREYIIQMFQNIGLEMKNIDKIFLTGGSSLAIPIKNIFVDMFGEDKLYQGHIFSSVAYGLSLYCLREINSN